MTTIFTKLFPNITKNASVVDNIKINNNGGVQQATEEINNKILDNTYNYLKNVYKADMEYNENISDVSDITQLHIYNILSKIAILSSSSRSYSEKDDKFVRFLNSEIENYDNTVIHGIYKSFSNINETIEDLFVNLT